MWVLLRTYFDIIALRKGPESIPGSWIVLAISFALLAVFWLLQISVVDNLSAQQIVAAWLAYALALAFYSAVVYLTGFGQRLLATLSTIVACGSLLSTLALLETQVMSPILGSDTARSLATVIWFWSVPVKGHVVARAIEQHWFVGVTIAMSAFILRLGVEAAFVAPAT